MLGRTREADQRGPAAGPIVIVGAGAVGSWLAAALSAAGSTVTLVARREHAARINAAGLTARRGNLEFRVPVTIAATVGEAIADAPATVVLVAVKSYDTPGVADELAAVLDRGSSTCVVAFANGVGSEDCLSAALPGIPVVPAILTTWARLTEPGIVQAGTRGGAGLARLPLSGTGAERGGPPSGALDPTDPAIRLANSLVAGGVPTRLYQDGRSLKWSKLLLNMVAAATGAALDWPPPMVLAHAGLRGLELAAWREAIAVLHAQRIRPVSLPGYPVDWFVRTVDLLPDRALGPLAWAAGRGRGGRVPGPVQDLRRGRGQTEIDAIQGAVARAGAAAGVSTPVNAALSGLVARIASGTEPWEAYRGRPDAVIAAVRGPQP